MKNIDPKQAWFWKRNWQEGEKEAEADISSGKVKKFKSVEDLIKDLDK
jgi:hypothetical protein